MRFIITIAMKGLRNEKKISHSQLTNLLTNDRSFEQENLCFLLSVDLKPRFNPRVDTLVLYCSLCLIDPPLDWSKVALITGLLYLYHFENWDH